ncbi:MAG: hypothetical protein ABGZ24_21585 [Fuerstiella sp.]
MISRQSEFGRASQLASGLETYVQAAAKDGTSLHDVEQKVHETVLQIGQAAMKLLIDLQPDGDLGPTVETSDGVTLHRSEQPVDRPLQTIFGRFEIPGFVYSRGANRKVELRPVDALLQLPDSYGSYLFEEFAQFFCVEQAYERSKDDILAALFRDPSDKRPADNPRDANVRPEPVARQLTARFAKERMLDEERELVSGTVEAVVWASLRVDDRHQRGQPLVCLCDGQPSLWETIDRALEKGPAAEKIEILDLLHACKYVWDAAKIFHHHREQQEAFARERMDRLLSGGVAGVIRGLRRMDTDRKLTGEKLKTINTVCGYLTNNATRMKYDEYLQAGYPIATGVIEGACRYVVKDRMERSGMRWSLPGAQAMLHVRCIHHSTERTQFYKQRILNEQQSLYPTAT